MIERDDMHRSQTPGSVSLSDSSKAYLECLIDRIRLGPRRLTVAVDCGNGTASLFAPALLEAWGCRVIPLYCESDGTFPNHFPDPVVPDNLKDLSSTVLREGADLGVAYDGDADRIGVVDEKGRILWGDTLMILFWREILAKMPGSLAIVEVKCSQAVADEVERLGGKPIFFRTGHSLIKAKMKQEGCPFAGEMSGHMFFADEYFGYDDALYATGRLLRILSNSSKSLSEMTADIPEYYSTPEIRVQCPDEEKASVVEAVKNSLASEHPVIDVDGVRVLFCDGWGLVRASNTEPVLVVRCEAKTPEGLERIKAVISQLLSEFDSVGPVCWG